MKNIFNFKKLGFKPLVCVAIISFQLLTFSSFAQFSGGNGTEKNPYIITTAAELVQLATFVNTGNVNYNDKYYKLGGNINLSAYGAGYNNGKGWVPIGKYDYFNPANYYPFRGNFNGDSNTITGLYINDTLSFGVGLFGSTNKAAIYNLSLDSVNIKGGGYVGAIIGHDSCSSIAFCNSSGNIKAGSWVGGLLGWSPLGYGVHWIYSCYSSCNIIASGYYIGGIAGKIGELYKIMSCYSTGNISGLDYVGGIAGGISDDAAIYYCYSTGNVSGRDYIGGIAGYIDGSFLSNCYSIGGVTGNNYVGGIVGRARDNGCTPVQMAGNVALNLSVKGEKVGRIMGDNVEKPIVATHNLKNVAYEGILTKADDAVWTNKAIDDLDGEDIDKEAINADGTLGGAFISTQVTGWTTQNGKLPGLFGKPVEMPEHLQKAGQGTTSIAERDNSDIRVYPNPTNGELRIESVNTKIDNVEVYDIAGKLVQTHRLNSTTNAILDVSKLSTGTYFLTIYSEGQKTTKKFVKE